MQYVDCNCLLIVCGIINSEINLIQGRIQAIWETVILVWQPKSGTRITVFTMHLIISKWLLGQKCRQKRQKTRQKDVEVREETVYKSVFIYLQRNRS